MSEAWITILLLAVATAAIKAAGPLAVGGRQLGPRVAPVIDLLAPAILAGLIVVETVGGDGAIDLDPRLAGVAAAGCVLLARPRWTLVAITVAAVVTALLRALL
jgi:branched-subunit amino acid transport protein